MEGMNEIKKMEEKFEELIEKGEMMSQMIGIGAQGKQSSEGQMYMANRMREYKKKNEQRESKTSNYVSQMLTSDRKTYYEAERLEQEQEWNRWLKWIYWLLWIFLTGYLLIASNAGVVVRVVLVIVMWLYPWLASKIVGSIGMGQKTTSGQKGPSE